MANDRADAANTVTALAFFGSLAALGGIAWAYVVWPDGYHDSRLAVVLALVLTAAGGFALMGAVVAGAVRVGIRWSGLRDEIVHELRHPPAGVDASHLDGDGR